MSPYATDGDGCVYDNLRLLLKKAGETFASKFSAGLQSREWIPSQFSLNGCGGS